jgi:hypothetical protein
MMDAVTLAMAKADTKKNYNKNRKGFAPAGTAFQRLMATLDEGKVSCGLTINGDSTGKTAGNTRWPEIVGPWLADQFPNYAVQISHWDLATLTMLPPVTLSGTPSARSVRMLNAPGGLHHPGYGYVLAGDLDIRVKVSFPQWPIVDDTKNQIASRWGNAAGLNSWDLFVQTNGRFRLKWSSDGLNQAATAPSSLPITPTPNVPIWLRATLTLATGTVAFYTSTDGTSWTAQGSTAGAGATTLYDASTQHYMLGSTGTSPGTYTATIDDATFYGLEVRDGIGGPSVVPFCADTYVPGTFNAVNGVTYSGKPVLTISNGSWPGAALVHMDDPANRPKLNPLWHNPMVEVFNLAHNEGVKTGKPYLALWDSYLANLKTRYGGTMSFALMTQNPKVPGLAGYVDAHAMRRRDLLGWAQRNGISVIDVYKAFLESSTPLTSLVDPDGIHPSDASGSPLWANVVKDYLTGKITA